jgi:cytochrome P450
MVVFLFLLLIFILLATYYAFQMQKRYLYFSERGIPTPPFRYFFGHLKTLWNAASFHRQFESWTKQYGKIYGIYQGAIPTLVVSDPEFIEEVFVKQFHVFHARRPFFETSKFQNLFSASGAQWRRHHHVINPTFSPAKLKLMSPLINGCISNFMGKLADQAKTDSEFNICPNYNRVTMDMICKYTPVQG